MTRDGPTLLLPFTTGTVCARPAPPLYTFSDEIGDAPGGRTPNPAVSPATASRVTHPLARAAYWDAFYTRHGGRFFKDRHWLGREFGGVLGSAATVLEVGCGVGNAALMLLVPDPAGGGADPAAASRTVYACDFAPAGVALMVARAGEMGVAGRLRAWVADATVPGALVARGPAPPRAAAAAAPPPPASLDAATLLFALSAMPPGLAMQTAVANVGAALKPGGCALVRDYCEGDHAQARLAGRAGGRRVRVLAGEEGAAGGTPARAPPSSTGGLFMRGDGTLAYYFDGAAELAALFRAAGFTTHSARIVEATKVNRASGAEMPRRWVQGVFRWGGGGSGVPAGVPPPPPPVRAEVGWRGRRARGARRKYRPEWERDDSPPSSSPPFFFFASSPDEARGGDAAAAAASSSASSSSAASSSACSSSSSSSSSGTARAAARLLSGLGGGGGEGATAPSSSSPLPPLEAATLRLPPPLGTLSILAAPGELRNTTGHTGLLVWGSAPALATALLVAAATSGGSLPFLRAGPVLEVGCGCAPSLALACLSAGAPRYLATDGSPVALALYARNFAAYAWRVVAERARIRRLAWGGEGEGSRGVGALVAAHTVGGAGFTTVLGADVLYSAPAVPRLMASVGAALARSPAARALFCFQVRGVGLGAVAGAAAEVGLVPAPVPPALAAAAAEGGVGRPGDLLQLVAFGWGKGVTMKTRE